MNGMQSAGAEGVILRFMVHEKDHHGGLAAHDWLLQTAKALGIRGGSAFHAIAGYGRRSVLHEQRFFELAGELPIEVSIVCTADEATRLLAKVEETGLSLFYALSPVRYGITSGHSKPAAKN